MRSSIMMTMVLSALSSVMAQAIINTPASLIACQPAAITFSGGTAPYFISVIPGGQTSAAALENFPTQNAAGTYTWNVDLAAGTSISLAIRDSTGVVNYSQVVTILAGTSTSCIGSNSAGSGSASSGTGSSVAASSPAAAGSSTPAAGSSSPAAATSSAATSVAAATRASTTPATSAPATSATSSSSSSSASVIAPATTSAARTAAASSSYGINALAMIGAAALALAA